MNSEKIIRVVAYLLLYLGVPVMICFELVSQTVTVVLGLIYMLIVMPIGILQLIDFYRSNNGNTTFSRAFNVLFRAPLALFGLVCLVTGVTIVGWILYNVFIERQKEYTGPKSVWGFGSFGLGIPLILFGWSTLRLVVRRTENVNNDSEEQKKFNHQEDDATKR